MDKACLVERDVEVRYPESYVVYKNIPCYVSGTDGMQLRLRPLLPGHGEVGYVDVRDPDLVDAFPCPRYINTSARALWVYRNNSKTYRRPLTARSVSAKVAGTWRMAALSATHMPRILVPSYASVEQALTQLEHNIRESVAVSQNVALVNTRSGVVVCQGYSVVGTLSVVSRTALEKMVVS